MFQNMQVTQDTNKVHRVIRGTDIKQKLHKLELQNMIRAIKKKKKSKRYARD